MHIHNVLLADDPSGKALVAVLQRLAAEGASTAVLMQVASLAAAYHGRACLDDLQTRALGDLPFKKRHSAKEQNQAVVAWAKEVLGKHGNPYTERWEGVLHHALAPFVSEGSVEGPAGKKAEKTLKASARWVLTAQEAERFAAAPRTCEGRLAALRGEQRLSGF